MADRRTMPLKQAVSETSKRMDKEARMSFERLVASIRQMHEELASRAGRAVNVCLTARNWLIGLVIFEYQQHGSDRAAYGEQLLEQLAERLRKEGMERVEARELRRYRQFYLAYPQMRETLSPELDRLAPLAGSPRTVAQIPESKPERPGNRETASPKWALPGEKLLHSLSFSHFDLLIQIDDPLERAFYEVECIRGNWPVRELKRQIASLYFERSGLSMNKKKPAALVRKKAEPAAPGLAIRDPYVFEFLGLKPREAMVESKLQDALLDKLQEFLLELGRGFCFEARRKRILIGDEHFFVDLVFYHRILKCHVLIELKVDEFSHQHLGQLNTYVSWFRQNEMFEGDNPPVGILLCTRKNRALVEYALAGMDNHLFVSKYRLELPKKEDIQRFIEEQVREVGDGT